MAAHLRNVVFSAPANSIGLVQKIIPVAQSAFRVLVDRDDDCLDVVMASAASS